MCSSSLPVQNIVEIGKASDRAEAAALIDLLQNSKKNFDALSAASFHMQSASIGRTIAEKSSDATVRLPLKLQLV